MSAQPLAGKVALITGSSRGIGAAIAARLASEGANVIVNYVGNEKAAQSTVDAINARGAGKAHAIKCDVSSVESAKQLVAETEKVFGPIDLLLLNAGIMGNEPFAKVDEAYYDRHFNTNVKGPFFLAQAAAEHMKPGSRIVFFSTSLTINSAITPNYIVYVGTKGAVEQMARVLAKDLGHKGITVNVISPGPVGTELFFNGKSEQLINMIKSVSPFNELGRPEDIANAAAFLCGPDGRWVSGQNLRVNGAGFV